MPKLFNLDHQHAILADGTVVAPGESHEFTRTQTTNGVSGVWSVKDPREGLDAEKAFKRRRDSTVDVPDSGPVPSQTDNDPDPAVAGEKE